MFCRGIIKKEAALGTSFSCVYCILSGGVREGDMPTEVSAGSAWKGPGQLHPTTRKMFLGLMIFGNRAGGSWTLLKSWLLSEQGKRHFIFHLSVLLNIGWTCANFISILPTLKPQFYSRQLGDNH